MSGIVSGVIGLAGAGLTAYGASQQPEGIQQHQVPMTGWNPNQDPLLSALSMNANAGIGSFDPNTYRQASPVQQLLNQAQSAGNLNQRKYRLLQESLNYHPDVINQARTLREATKTAKGKEAKAAARTAYNDFLGQNNMTEKQFLSANRGMNTAERLAQSAGYENLGGLFAENESYLGKLPEIQGQFQPVADQLRAGLLSSQGRIGQYLQDLPNLLTGDANPFIDQLKEEALINAQKYGMNPYKGLEEARSQALQRALQLIGGEQAVQAGQQQAALPIAQLRQQGGATAAGIGAGQAQMLAGALQSQQAAQAAQAQTYGNLGQGLMGAGVGLFGALQKGPATQNRDSVPNNYPTTSNNYGVWEP